MRVPSGGRLASGVLVRTMIQFCSSHSFAGNVIAPVNVAPACNSIVSLQLALFNAVCRLSPEFTETLAPGAGVSARVVLRYTRGSSAGPSKALFADTDKV